METLIVSKYQLSKFKQSRWFGWGVAAMLALTNLYLLSILHARNQFWSEVVSQKERLDKLEQDQKTLNETFTKGFANQEAANDVLISVSGYIKQKESSTNVAKLTWNK